MTTVLTMALLAIENKVDFPKINYLTASDIYIIVCLGFIISSIVGFAIVYYRTKLIYEHDELIKYRFLKLRKKMSKNVHQIDFKVHNNKELISNHFSPRKINVFHLKYIDETDVEYDGNEIEDRLKPNRLSQHGIKQTFPLKSAVNIFENSHRSPFDFMQLLNDFQKNLQKLKKNVNIKRKSLKSFERVSRVDILSRILYPIFFFLFNAIYWYVLIFLDED
jgi:hypothetical protein